MRQPSTRPFVYPDPVPSPLSLGSSFRAGSPLDSALEEIVVVPMASPILALASIVRETNSIGHHASPILLRRSQATDYRLMDAICS